MPRARTGRARMGPSRGRSFEEFWPEYLEAHSHPVSRRVHAVGTIAAVALGIAAVVRRDWRLALLVPIVGYGPAWLSHVLFEGNRPKTLSSPLNSLRADFRMVRMMFTGALEGELRRVRVLRGSTRQPGGEEHGGGVRGAARHTAGRPLPIR